MLERGATFDRRGDIVWLGQPSEAIRRTIRAAAQE
jgi:hypothetical protein